MKGQPRIPSWIVLVFYLVLGGGAFLFSYLLLHRNPFRPFPDRLDQPIVDLFLGAAMGFVVVVASRVLDRFFEWSRALTRLFKELLGDLRPGDALVIALASSLGEEILFRGVLLPAVGLVASSLIFGLVHGISPGRPGEMLRVLRQFAPLVVIATALGFAFGLAVEYTGNILVAVIAHFTINFLNLAMMYQERWRSDERSGGDG